MKFSLRAESYCGQMIRYAAVAAASLVLDIVLLALLRSVLHAPVLLAASLAYLVSMVVNYWISMRWVFKNTANHSQLMVVVIFFGVGFVGLGITDSVIWVMTTLFGLGLVLAKLVAIAVSFFWSYGARRASYTSRHQSSTVN